MAIVFNRFNQPANPGDVVGVDLVGDPVLNSTEIVRFIKYGQYTVLGDHNGDAGSAFRRYDLQLTEKYSLLSVPAGTYAQVEKEGFTHSPLAYNATIFLSFKEEDFRSLIITDKLTLAAQHHAPGKVIKVRIQNISDYDYALTFPADWIFMGFKPTLLAANTTGELLLTSYGQSDANVTAAWAAQSLIPILK